VESEGSCDVDFECLQVRPPESGVAKVWLVIPRRDVAVAPLLSGKTDRRHFVLITPSACDRNIFLITSQATHDSKNVYDSKYLQTAKMLLDEDPTTASILIPHSGA